MPAMKRLLPLLCALLPLAAAAAELPLDRIKLPPGFGIALFARVDNARGMALGAENTLFVGSMRAGKVHALKFDSDYKVTQTRIVAEGLQLPAGVAFRDGVLYVSAVSRILRFDGIERRLARLPYSPPQPSVVRDSFPRETHHGWKFIAFGPDGKLYVPVGAPCNICEPDPDRYASILRMNPDGSNLEVFARGVRNTVGFAWHPETQELWFTDNGRDRLGDDLPPDELNHAPRAGLHFGYPYCHGGTLADPEFGGKRPCADFTPPAQNLGPHVAALGMRFYDGAMFPPAYRNQVFIAEHGSWNRTRKIGYRVSLVRLRDGRAVSYEPFAEGWLQGESAWGRPADVQVLPDGSLLVSDDLAGAIYRITYKH
ncbi:MAG: sorbosone dehydrogenase family protein [Rhodocyclaceae bacterium]|jgi:glucose/arabinose dehydrogenase